MIAKESDPTHSDSRRAQAGAQAERDMAFYLRRAFGDHRRDVRVFNDIRVEHEDEVAQMDHLVLHAHGMFVIESKSVSGEIQILPDGQFIRVYGGGKRTGMPSPVLQARRQADLLRRLLQAHNESLRDRKLFGMLQGGFINCPIEIRVAISDRSIIRGDKHAPEVRKADVITEDIESRISAHRRGGSLLNLDTKSDDGLYRFTDAELDRVERFLLTRHVPRGAGPSAQESTPHSPLIAPSARTEPARAPQGAPPPRSSSPEPSPSSSGARIQYLCSKCHSLDLRILHGKYGYYFKCKECGGNTWIDTRLDGSDRKGRIRKSGRDFFLVCPESGDERRFFTNPDDAE